MDSDHLDKVMSVLDALILIEQSKLGQELVEKARLRARQIEIAVDEQRAFESVHGFDETGTVMQAFQNARVRKLRSMQTELQPDLARAALRREKIAGELKRLMRQKLALQVRTHSLHAGAEKHGQFGDEMQTLFEMMKRV